MEKRYLGEGDDTALARSIEAGCYAHWLRGQGDPRAGLDAVVIAGEQAREALWSVGIRIATQQANRSAVLTQCAVEDLFQEGCVAVAEAIDRYDHRLGVRFTTFVYECIQRAVLEGARRARLGRPPTSRGDRLAAARVAQERHASAARGIPISVRQAAERAGVSIGAAARGASVIVSLDGVRCADPAAHQAFEQFEHVDVLELLPYRQRVVLEQRFGLAGMPRSLAEVAKALGVSISTVSRWEHQALAMARRALERDQTRITSTKLTRGPGVSCVASQAQ